MLDARRISMMKYVFVTSDVGHNTSDGIIATSIAVLLKAVGQRVTLVKIDPNIKDAQDASQSENEDIFVLEDGAEVDPVLGEYERCLNITLTRDHIITGGKLLEGVILGGGTDTELQIVNNMQGLITRASKLPVEKDSKLSPQVCIIEFDGDAADLDVQPFAQALANLRASVGNHNVTHFHISHIPIFNGDQIPQHAKQGIQAVQTAGLYPDMVLAYNETELLKDVIRQIANDCQLRRDQVIAVHGHSTPYQMPTLLEEKGIMHYLANFVGVGSGPEYPIRIKLEGAKLWRSWTSATGDAEQNIASDRKMPPTIISLIGNFTAYSHLSVTRSLEHAALSCHRRLQINFITASHLDPSAERLLPVQHVQALATLHSSHGILVPGGFGSEGTEGMIEAIRWARESRTPFLGICLGMQLTVIEFARNVCEMPKATSAEFARSADIFDGEKLITYMPDFDRAGPDDKMRLGVRKTYFQRDTEWSKARASYTNREVSEPDYLIAGGPSAFVIHERYRHRLAVNPKYFDVLETNGLRLVGKDDTGTRTGVVEIQDHPWFVGVQYHPEYTSKVMDPNRCILGFFKASSEVVPLQLLITSMESLSLE